MRFSLNTAYVVGCNFSDLIHLYFVSCAFILLAERTLYKVDTLGCWLHVAYMCISDRIDMMIWWYDIFVNCIWVDSRWQ